MDDSGRSDEDHPTREGNGRPAEHGTGCEARRGPTRSPANPITWQLALYALVLGVLCVLLIPLTALWWIVPLPGVAGPLLLAFVGGRPGNASGSAPEPAPEPPPTSAAGVDPVPESDRPPPSAPLRDASSIAAHAVGTPELLADPVSARQREVLAVLASSRTPSEAARDLFVSVGTVKSHTANIYRKLGAKNRGQAIARARELGLLPYRP